MRLHLFLLSAGKKLLITCSKKLSGKIYYEYDMRRLNWFNLGGPTKVFFKPKGILHIHSLLKYGIK